MPATEQLIRVGHSPDPDDAFMFYALAKGMIDTAGYEFTHELVDIETLNQRAFSGELELTAVSIHAYAYLQDKYLLCNCGASMGDNYGPMVVAREACTIDDLKSRRIAIPGKLTSATLSLRMFLGQEFDQVIVPFDQIIPAVAAGKYEGTPIDAGLLIHEGQLTYTDQDLKYILHNMMLLPWQMAFLASGNRIDDLNYMYTLLVTYMSTQENAMNAQRACMSHQNCQGN